MSDIPDLAPVPANKRALLVLTHAMEQAFEAVPAGADAGPPGLVIALFQRREYFDIEAARYESLAAAGHTVVVGFAGSVDDLPPGVVGVSLPEHNALAQTWALIMVRGDYATSLVATDLHDLSTGEMTLEASRLFRAHWTFRRESALGEARVHLLQLADDLPMACWSAAAHHLEHSEQLPISAAEDRLATAADHLVTAVEAGERRATRLRARLETTLSLVERDQLTGLNNRHYLERFLGGDDRPADLVLLLLDVDNLKKVNDTYGHAAGDAVLSAVARALRENCRPGDVIVRWGGDEFLILVPDLGSETALILGERLGHAIAGTRPANPWQNLPLSVSIGVCESRRTPLPIDRLDAALHMVKRAGKGHVAMALDAAS